MWVTVGWVVEGATRFREKKCVAHTLRRVTFAQFFLHPALPRINRIKGAHYRGYRSRSRRLNRKRNSRSGRDFAMLQISEDERAQSKNSVVGGKPDSDSISSSGTRTVHDFGDHATA